jgi:hypothetical protein
MAFCERYFIILINLLISFMYHIPVEIQRLNIFSFYIDNE